MLTYSLKDILDEIEGVDFYDTSTLVGQIVVTTYINDFDILIPSKLYYSYGYLPKIYFEDNQEGRDLMKSFYDTYSKYEDFIETMFGIRLLFFLEGVMWNDI